MSKVLGHVFFKMFHIQLLSAMFDKLAMLVLVLVFRIYDLVNVGNTLLLEPPWLANLFPDIQKPQHWFIIHTPNRRLINCNTCVRLPVEYHCT